MITALDVFEEFRFILELTAAEWMFAIPFAKGRRYILRNGVLGLMALLVSSLFYFVIYKFDRMVQYPNLLKPVFFVAWYMILVMFSIFYLWTCFELKKEELLFLAVSAYTAQHIEYVVMNEMIAKGIFPALSQNMKIYILACIFSCVVLYWILYKVFAIRLRTMKKELFQGNGSNFYLFGFMLAVLICSTFMEQYAFLADDGTPNYFSAIADLLACFLILIIQYSMFYNIQMSMEQRILEQMLYDRKKQYEISKETVELVNHKCHDLKNQMLAIKGMGDAAQEELRREIDSTVRIYDAAANTENEVLNTLLTEKSFFCERHGISLSYMADASRLAFLKTFDLYALVGNALDNAIECVSRYEDTRKRIVSMNIDSRNQFLHIEVSNYFDGELVMENGIPVSNKADMRFHGFGVKSMQMIVKKYGGWMEIETDGNTFLLEIVIPMPQNRQK